MASTKFFHVSKNYAYIDGVVVPSAGSTYYAGRRAEKAKRRAEKMVKRDLMKAEKQRGESSGAGLLSLLTVLFIGLKLTGFITWSWWWVLSPIPIGFVVLFLIVLIASIINSA